MGMECRRLFERQGDTRRNGNQIGLCTEKMAGRIVWLPFIAFSAGEFHRSPPVLPAEGSLSLRNDMIERDGTADQIVRVGLKLGALVSKIPRVN